MIKHNAFLLLYDVFNMNPQLNTIKYSEEK